MIELTVILNNKLNKMYFKVKDIKAIKVVNEKTHIFIKHAGFILGDHFVVMESPEDIGKKWIDSIMKTGKGIGINGVL